MNDEALPLKIVVGSFIALCVVAALIGALEHGKQTPREYYRSLPKWSPELDYQHFWA